MKWNTKNNVKTKIKNENAYGMKWNTKNNVKRR